MSGVSPVIYSSTTDLWETPQWIFDELNQEFDFALDVCAVAENAKCENYYTPEMDGLQQPWEGVCWCNPPYGKDICKWVKKASESKATVVMLVPARTDTKWFHDWVYHKAEIRFVKGRLRFGNSKNPAPFPSMILVYRNNSYYTNTEENK